MKQLKKYGDNYVSPTLSVVNIVFEAGFAVSNEGLTEDSWSWDE